MKISRATEIVLELAEQAVVSDFDTEGNEALRQQRDEQDTAIDIVRNILGSLTDADREA